MWLTWAVPAAVIVLKPILLPPATDEISALLVPSADATSTTPPWSALAPSSTSDLPAATIFRDLSESSISPPWMFLASVCSVAWVASDSLDFLSRLSTVPWSAFTRASSAAFASFTCLSSCVAPLSWELRTTRPMQSRTATEMPAIREGVNFIGFLCRAGRTPIQARRLDRRICRQP